jgi:hypothetical protein
MVVPGAVPSDRPTEILSFTLMLGAFKAAQKNHCRLQKQALLQKRLFVLSVTPYVSERQ